MTAPTVAGVAAIARVEPLTTARALRGPFDYRLPAALAGVEVGARLVVPFGGRSVLGVVVGLAEETVVPPERLAEPEETVEPAIPPELVALAEWMATEYCSTPARALRLVGPAGAGVGTRPRVRPSAALHAVLTARGREALGGTGAERARLGPRQREVLLALREGGGPVAGADGPVARRLATRGLLTLERRERRRTPATASVGARAASTAPVLTAEQGAALDPIRAALAGESAEWRLLLHGVTGSGKTEVYLQAVAAALAAGRGAIVLVPEIGLTPQTAGRFQARFGDIVAVLHSDLGAGERYDEWRRLARGEARICVGPRSAVFAPVRDLGLVVVDEEHDGSYKHEGDPRYDARAVAEHRAQLAGAVLLAGSATPRPEAVHRLRRLGLEHRVDGRALPPVEILDMREARHPLHPETRAALAEVRRAAAKAIVLLNRRGWSNFLSCRTCGHVWSCPNCDVALVLHRTARAVACHHCGHRERVPAQCWKCASVSVARHGAGTERMEAELVAALGDPGFPVFRLDGDAGGGPGGIGAVLQRFDRARAGILVGTQMVAKGHDFPDVTLGVVLDADATLRFPDFRAEERTFALVAQLAGRAGRGPRGGRVLVQTLAPGAPSIRFAARHDARGFVAGELARRRALSYPPFSSLIRVVCTGPDRAGVDAAAAEVRRRLEVPGAAVLGPAPLFRLRGRERAQLVVKATDRPAAIAAVGGAVADVASARAAPGVALSVDVDPR